MTIGCAVCAVLVFAGFCIFDKFSLPLIFGVVLGYLLAVGNFYFMSVGVTVALDTGEEIEAKKKLRFSYVLRTIVILGLIVASILLDQKFGIINWIPVAIGVFYVRIVIAAYSVINYFKLKNSPPLPDENGDDSADGSADGEDENEDDEDEDEDEFEKFVGHFSRGPVPGKDDKNKKTNEKDKSEENK